MENIDLAKKIKNTAFEMNADFIGIADPECFLVPNILEINHKT